MSSSPPVAERLARLHRQGATVEVPPQRPMPWVVRLCLVLGMSLLGMLLVGFALALSGMALIVHVLIFAPMVLLVHGLLR